jgi:hypothetical protein
MTEEQDSEKFHAPSDVRIDASYATYDQLPLETPDAWGDLASFRQAARSASAPADEEVELPATVAPSADHPRADVDDEDEGDEEDE